uniref:D,D-heptose 1,7-bisphosphate phosphatase n=1 Tax=uncultured Acidobacteriota bacterium TaxID=171953 RepID=Q7X334_9BACT|nr:putative phosphatase [uncultured Acidobacteriota bacterium]
MGIADGGRRAVFLDRDGVINRVVLIGGRPHPPPSVAAMHVLPGVAEALARLSAAGFRLVVVTNQPDVARRTQQRAVIDAMHAHLAATLPIDDFRVCDHDDADECSCRKPKAGLLEEAAREGGLSLVASFMVGDRWRDIEAGRRAGCTTVFIDCGYREQPPDRPDVTVRSLPEAADWILRRSQLEDA